VWEALVDTDTVMNVHIGSSGWLAITAADAPMDVMITLQPMNIVQAAADLLWSKPIKKYKDLKIAPNAPEELDAVLKANNVTDDETNKMTYQNAMRWYHWDPFSHIPKDQATVGALRKASEGHDVSIQALSHSPKTGDSAKNWQERMNAATAMQK